MSMKKGISPKKQMAMGDGYNGGSAMMKKGGMFGGAPASEHSMCMKTGGMVHHESHMMGKGEAHKKVMRHHEKHEK